VIGRSLSKGTAMLLGGGGGDGWLNAESYLKFTVYGQDSLYKI
jgi:hypothetical protein